MPNIAAHLVENVRSRPEKTAVIDGNAHYTFRQLWLEVQALAAGLRSAGFCAGERLGIMLPSGIEFIAYEFATFLSGGTAVPINLHYTASELSYLLTSYDVDFLAIHHDLVSRLEATNASSMLRLIIVCGTAENLRPGTMTGEELRKSKAAPIAMVDRQLDDVALMLHTSATTGRAKGVMLTLGNLRANYDQTPGWLGIGEDDRILCALPLYNTFALNQCINACMVTGATLVLVPRFESERVLQAIETHRCTFFPAVPAMLQKLLNAPQLSKFDLRSIRRMVLGGAPVPAPLLENIYRTMGAQTVVMTGYGLTEATALVSLEFTSLNSDGTLRRPKCVGRALPGIDIDVIDSEGRAIAAHEVGEIRIRGSNIMRGYYRMPQETEAAVVDGWLLTGDLGFLDSQQLLYIVDRKKDLIIRGGQNVYPNDIEERLYAHPAVSEAAAIGRADDAMGEVPVAFVALRPGHSASNAELLEWCKAQLAYFKVPREVHILSELPKGPTGKILRRALRVPVTSAAD
jgi:long-chain acyl-CoA synthetase